MITPFYNVMQVRDSWDWSQTNKLAPVSDQLTCKASWAISAIETLEAAIAIRKNISAADTRISAQHLIDCDKTNDGCLKEGKSRPLKAWLFLKVDFVPQEIYPVKKF
jgi:C1A family cysteine protease